MEIANNILKYYLRDVYFITGTAYAGKSTMVKMLAERYGLIPCGENYHAAVSDAVADPQLQPNICYFETMKDWQEFISRTPEEYDRWITVTSREAAEFEVAQLLRMLGSGKIIVDTNIPLDILHEISDYDHVAVMLSPQSMSVERFFDRDDPEKQFLLSQIQAADDPAWAMENYKNCIAKVNSREHFEEYARSGFFTVYRDSADGDTRETVLKTLAGHFGFDRQEETPCKH